MVCDTERERLPFAFVTANVKLLANCEQQLIRQTTRPDSGGLGDCYTFAARTVDGLRNSADRVNVLKLHMLLAARRLWAPNTITSVHGWEPLHPLGSDGVYRREEFDRRESIPKLKRSFLLDENLHNGAIGPGDYAYYQGGVPGLGGVQFGPWLPDADWVEPEDEPNPPTFGRMGPRHQGDDIEEFEQRPMERQVLFSDDSFGEGTAHCKDEGHSGCHGSA